MIRLLKNLKNKKIFYITISIFCLLFSISNTLRASNYYPFPKTSNILTINEWYTYISNIGKVRVRFPAHYDEIIIDDKKRTYKITSQINDKIYMFGFSMLDDDFENSDQLLKISINSFSDAVKGVVKNIKEYKYNKFSGLEALIEIDKEAIVHYRVIIIDKIQYQILVITNTHEQEAVTIQYFNSFKIIE